MVSKNILFVGAIILLVGAALGYSLSFFISPDGEYSLKNQILEDDVERFRTYLTCIPPSHQEKQVTSDTWIHYNYDDEDNLIMIEIETTKKQDSSSWGYLPDGHPGMEFEHWALHIWFKDPEEACLDFEDLITKLREEGLSVEQEGEIEQPFFSTTGYLLDVNGEMMQVFVYDDVHSANNEAALISPDGSSVGDTQVMWISTPHFYQNGKLIIIYIGDDEALKKTFQEVIGYQFAGG